jgi:acyl-CoA thioesterase I
MDKSEIPDHLQSMVALLFNFILWLPIAQAQTEPAVQLIVALGDSLTEGYGVAQTSAYPAVLEGKLLAAGYHVKIQNAGISGSTSASAPARIKWILKAHPKIVILALGANDALRGLPVDNLEKNLSDTIEIAEKEKVKIILCGVPVPTNYGDKYRSGFAAVFKKLAKKYPDATYVPSLLEGVAAISNLNQVDGIHPNEKGHVILADHLFPIVKGLL